MPIRHQKRMVAMAEGLRDSVWFYRGLFVAVALFLLFARLMPLDIAEGNFPGPDLLLCLIFAWAMKRPDYLPIWLLAIVLLFEDLILMRPPGLWTAIVIAMVEVVRNRAALARELAFWAEWVLVAGMMLICLLVYRFVFTVSFLEQPAFGFAVMQIFWSILCYPVVVFLARNAIEWGRQPAVPQATILKRL